MSPNPPARRQAGLIFGDPDTNSTIPCPQCERVFYRKDLLQRHLTLKHGKVAGTSRGADLGTLPLVEASSPASPDRNRPRGIQGAEGPCMFPDSTLAVDVRGSVTTGDDVVLPISGDLFAFPSPTLDLAQDWGWLHQNPLPALPVGSDLVGELGDSNQIHELVSTPRYPSCRLYGQADKLGPAGS